MTLSRCIYKERVFDDIWTSLLQRHTSLKRKPPNIGPAAVQRVSILFTKCVQMICSRNLVEPLIKAWQMTQSIEPELLVKHVRAWIQSIKRKPELPSSSCREALAKSFLVNCRGDDACAWEEQLFQSSSDKWTTEWTTFATSRNSPHKEVVTLKISKTCAQHCRGHRSLTLKRDVIYQGPLTLKTTYWRTTARSYFFVS